MGILEEEKNGESKKGINVYSKIEGGCWESGMEKMQSWIIN